mmetsp:Transcript_41324/g.96825  ORF Transcript_41324/g.96825 Transcript_41324/m.96825 type:complete len:202 (-) Transcript_41324:89-694(-)
MDTSSAGGNEVGSGASMREAALRYIPVSSQCFNTAPTKGSRPSVSLSQTMATCRRARVTATLVRRWSATKPTWCSGLLRTRLMTIASFSRPWKPSTVPSSNAGCAVLMRLLRSCSWALYGVMTPICSALTPASRRVARCLTTTSTSPTFACEPDASLVSSRSHPAVSMTTSAARVVSASVTPGMSPRVWPATDSAACSCPS